MVMDFAKRYKKLNPAQKDAVDCIDGPVMVIAGPGTGKTELLSVRAANILQKTDTLPENILCLTFTDSGSSAMRQRLTEIIGKDAYKVAIHTFHSFCVEVINQNSQYFFNNAKYKPADELSTYEIINKILSELDHNNPLISKQNGEYTQLRDISTAMSQIKKGGLHSQELKKLLEDNDKIIAKLNPILLSVFADRVSKSTIVMAGKAIEQIKRIDDTADKSHVTPLSRIVATSLENAFIEAGEKNTKPITAWKNLWMNKDASNILQLKSTSRQIKLHALNNVYEMYLKQMDKSELYDFDDMILQVVHKIEEVDELRFNLHEKFQYIMVDEFQDTNMAQMRILKNLTNNPAHDDTPNIMIVGDDDQAIYSFQGADISNIIDFRNIYKKAKIITLIDNYRSGPEILNRSRRIIDQGKNRLENIFDDINKKLTAHKNEGAQVNLLVAENIASERNFIASDIKSKIEAGQNPSEITIIARQHKEINELLPYLYNQNILVNYDRQDSVLESDIIKLIENISKLLIYLQSGRHNEANGLLPIIMAHPAFKIKPIELWKISTKAYDQHKRWIDIMNESKNFKDLSSWIIDCAKLSVETPLEQMLDIIIGKDNKDGTGFVSPIFKHYFGNESQKSNPEDYLIYLESLRTIREKLREHQPDQLSTLQTFVEFIALNRKAGQKIEISNKITGLESAINVMTAHKSKGLEFETVYIMNAIDSNWSKNSGHRQSISYPENLTLSPAGDSDDEKLRLFYVAMTRAKKELIISYSLLNNSNKETLVASFLLDDGLIEKKIDTTTDGPTLINTAEINWYQSINSPSTPTMTQMLVERMKTYKLSATHLNSFIDVSRDGPSMFLINQILRFPSGKSASADFGTSIHYALQSAHSYLTANKDRQSIEQIIDTFVNHLSKQHMLPNDLEHYTKKGRDILQTFLENNYKNFTPNQKSELNFSNQQSILDDAHLTGKLDVIEFDKQSKTATVTDYKTGKPTEHETGKTDYEKIKIHKYRQQLMFYKLLIEASRDYHDYAVTKGIIQFVEPTKSNKIVQIETDFSDQDLDDFKKLVSAVWTHITNLDFPDTSGYDPSFRGIIAFEKDLIENNTLQA